MARRVKTVGFCSSPQFVQHQTGAHHPERADRIRAIHRAIRAAGMIDSPDPFPDFSLDLGAIDGRGVKLTELTPRPAEAKWALAVHSEEHLYRVRHVCELGGGVLDQGDTPVGPESFHVGLLSLGSLLMCVDAVMTEKVQRAFSAARPPGHHAEPDRAMGFCLFSNIAIATRYLQQQYNIERIGIVDFDVHHGNGTQASLEDDPHKLFVSMHQHPRTCYPGSGYEHERGAGAGEGLTINVPFPPGVGDDEYIAAMEKIVIPRLNDFRPQVLLISAGFDAHREDPLAQIELSEECYERMTGMLAEVADRHAQGRIVSALEGGYNLRALGRSVVRHVIALAG
jgi:acetoin utilization deacetylase AcuC-like enzyme